MACDNFAGFCTTECWDCPYNINSRNENGTGCGENVCLFEQIVNENEQFYEENMPKLNVLSLFDGISCGRVALERAKIPVGRYYASEIDRYAIQVTQDNYPDTIQLGDVTKWREWDIDWSSIDLLIGGSPCQGFSSAGKGLNFDDPRSALFFVFVDVLNHIRNLNPNVKFLLENVKMKKEWTNIISEYLQVEPVQINSALVSAQNRQRLYWTNIAKIPQPEDKHICLKDILLNCTDNSYMHSIERLAKISESNFAQERGLIQNADGKCSCLLARDYKDPKCVFEKIEPLEVCDYAKGKIDEFYNKNGYIPKFFNAYNCSEIKDKSPTQTAYCGSQTSSATCLVLESIDLSVEQKTGKNVFEAKDKKVVIYDKEYQIDLEDGFWCFRKLTPIECERLQTLPDNYTAGISNSQRYKALGNGWTVDVIAHIFNSLKGE